MLVREEPMKHRKVPTHFWYILDVLDPLVCCWQSRIRPQVVIPPAIRCERTSKQRPQAMPQVAQQRIESQAQREQSCCDQAACTTERASLAGCGRAAFATGLNGRRASQKNTPAPQIFRVQMVEDSWPQNGLIIWPTRRAAPSKLRESQ